MCIANISNRTNSGEIIEESWIKEVKRRGVNDDEMQIMMIMSPMLYTV
jgi:predicted metal-dependent phosphotriesterase family hydrolase